MKRMIASRRTQLLARSALCGVLGAMAIGASSAAAQVTGVGTINSTTSNGGAVGVASGGGVTDITTNASRSIVNWADLTVTPTEALNFYFNNRSDIVVNRVAGAASIDGILNGCMATCATTGGNIWLLSTGGVLIGANTQINTGGFLASTGSLTDADILDGDMNFAFNGAPANSTISVANGASLNTSGGSLALIAPIVTTAAGSTVTATNGGDVIYGSAENYNVTFAPTGSDDLDLITFQVSSQSDGSGGTPGLTLNGTTTANQVFAAIVSKGGVAASILLGGNITATTASGENGDIVLSAGSGFTNGVADSPMGFFDASITQNTTSTLTGVNVTMRAADAVVANQINATGEVWLDSAWAGISQTGAITASSLRAEAGAGIDLTDVGNDFDTISFLNNDGSGAVSLTDSDGFQITGGVNNWTTAGTVNLTALNGSITQSGAGVIWAGRLNASATGDVALGNLSNRLATLGTLTAGGAISYRGSANFNLDGALTTASLTLRSDTGAITQTGAPLNVGQLSVQAETGINLNRVSNQIDEITGLSTTTGDIILISNGDLSLAGNITGAGIVSLHIFNGAITQNSGVITANSFTAVADTGLDLGGANQVAQLGRLTVGGTGDITFRNAGALVLTDDISAAGDNVNLYSTSGGITQDSGAITANRLTASAAGNIQLNTATNSAATIGGLASTSGSILYRSANSFDIQGDITTAIGTGAVLRTVGAGASITQVSGTVDVGWFGANANGSIILNGAANQIRRLVATSSGAGDVSIRTTTDLAMGQPVTAGQALSLTSDGRIYQDSTGYVVANTLNLSAVTGISLPNAAQPFVNSVQNLGTITNSTSGGIVIANYSGSNTGLTGNITAAGQSVSITDVAGGLNQTGGIITADTLSLSATGAITATQNNSINSLGSVAAGGGFSFVNTGQLYLTGDIGAAGHTVSLTTNSGQIEQTGGVITAGLLNLAAGGRIWVNNANAVASLGTVAAGGHILFRNEGNTVVGGDITANGFDVTLRSNTGSVTQTAGSDITSNSLQVIAQTGVILTNAGNAVGELSWMNGGSGGIAFGQTAGFQIGGPIFGGGQTVSLTSLGGAITQNFGSSLSAGTLNASAAATLTLNQGNNVDSLGVISTGGDFLFRDVDGFDLTGDITAAGQVVMLAQNGSINQTGGIITAGDINAMASVDLLLGGANQINAVSALSAGNDLLYRQVGDLSVPTISAADTVSLYSTTGDITQTGTITADTLVLGAGDDIVLGQNFVAKLGQIDAGGDFTAANAGGLSSGALELTNDITVGGAMTLVNPGAITQSGGAITAASLTLDTDGALTATGANSVTGATRLIIDGDVTWNSAGDLNLRVTTPGAASITSTGAILLDGGGASSVGGRLSLAAVTGISQAQTLSASDLGALTNTTSGGISLTTDSWMTLNGAVTATGQSVALNVLTGGIIQTSGNTITANRFSSTTTQGAFLNEINNVAQLGVINAGAHNFTFRTLGDLLVDGDITSALTVNLTSATGDVSQTAGSDITAGGLTVWAETGINLTNVGNDVDRLMTVINLGSGGIAYTQTDGFLIDSTIRALNQTVSLTSIAGGISETGTTFAQIEAGTLNASAAGALTLHRNNAVGTVSLNGTTITYVNTGSFAANVITGDDVTLTSTSGNITQTAGTGRIVANSLTASAATGLEFFGGQNDIVILAGLSSTSGGVTYRDMGGFEITGNISAVGQSVELISDATGADGDDIVQSGGAITALRLNGNSAGDFLLTRANAVTNLGLLNANDAFIFRNAGAITLVDNLSAGSVLTLISDSSAIMQNGGAITASTLNAISAQGISLSRVNDVDFLATVDSGAGDFNFRDIDAFDISGLITSDTGIMLQAGSNITQSSGSIVTGTLSLFAGGTAVVNGSGNDIDFLGLSTGMNALAFTDVDGFGISDRVFSSGAISLTATTGDIAEVAGGYLSANTLNVHAISGEIDLTGGNIIENVGDLMAGGDVTFHDTDGFLTFGNIAGDAVRLTTAAGGISQFSGAIGANSLLVSAYTGIDLSLAGNDVGAIAGMTNATSGGITYTDANSVNIDGAVTATGQTVTFNVGADLTQSYTGVITAQTVAGSAGGAFALADAPNVVAQLGPVTANSIDLVTVDTGLTIVGALTATNGVVLKADDFITQTAAGTITGDSLRAMADGDIILDQANDLNSITLLYSDLGDITYADVDGFSLDGSSLGDFWTNGTFTLTAGGTGDIEQSGVGLRATTLVVTAGGNITLDEANRVTNLGAMTAGGYIYHYDFDDIAVAGDINAGGSFNIISINGEIIQTGGLITATTISGQSEGDFTLNNFDARLNSAVSNTGDVDISNTGDIIIDNLVRVGAGNSVTLTSGGSIASNAAGRIEAGSLTLSAGTHINLTGAARNDIDTLAGVTAGTSLNFIDDDDFSLGGDIDIDGGASGTTANLRSVGGAITQTGGAITADGLTIETDTGMNLSGPNLVGALQITNGSGDVYFTNTQDLGVVSATSDGLVDIQTTTGRLDVLGQIIAGSIVLTGANGAYAGDLLSATGDVTVTAVTGNAMVGRISSGDDVLVQALAGSAQLQGVSLYADVDPEADGQTVRVIAAGDAYLGATSAAGITAQSLNRVSGAGTVSVTSTGGDASVFLSSMDTAVTTLSAGGDGATARVVVANGDLLLGAVAGDNVSLTAHGGIVSATSVTVGGGDYDLTGQDFSSGAILISGTARDRTITDTFGNLELTSNVSTQRNLTITAQGSILDGTGSVVIAAGLGGQGDLSITAASIAAYFAGGYGNVTLTALSGSVDVGTVLVEGDYTLTGSGFSSGTLSPLGDRAGTWSLTDLDGFDFTGLMLTYYGDIEIQAADAITGGSVQSINGSVTVNGPDDIDVEGLHAETGIAVTAGNALTIDIVDAHDGDISLTGRSVTVAGYADAGGDVLVNATNGAANVNAATAGGDITVSATFGDAILGAASLIGATGDLLVQAVNGDVVFGVLDYSTVSTDNIFSRAAGSTGTATLISSTGDVTANLWESARLDLVQASLDAEVSTETGDLEIGQIQALGGEISVETIDGSLTIGTAAATSGFVGLYSAGGDLTITGGVHGGAGVDVQTDGLLDGSLASTIYSGDDLQLVGGEVLLNRVRAIGAVVIGALNGDAYLEFAEAGTGLGVISAGDATVRSAEVQDGISIQADGDIIFGADTRALITGNNSARVNAGGACGCGGDIYLESLNGDVTVNLNSVTGTFDTIASGPAGDVNIVLNTGNLTIYELAGYNITADVNGSIETIIGAFSAGGNYSLTASNFLGNVLTPDKVFGTMGDYTIVDTNGGLDMTGVSVDVDGDILIRVLNFGGLSGDAQLTAGGDLTIAASTINVDTVEAAGDLTLNAGNYAVNVATSVAVGGDYTLTGAGFSAATLNPLGARAGDLRITDNGSNFDYSAGNLTYGGDITIGGAGAVLGGAITSLNGDIEIQASGSIQTGALSAVSGQIDVYGYSGVVNVASATALDDIYIYTSAGNAILGAATLLGTGTNSLLVSADGHGDAVLGSSTAGGITGANAFTSNGSTTTARVQAAGGRAYVHLDTSDAITAVTAMSGDIGIAVRSGDFNLGSARSTGQIDIDGPDGQLTVGSLTADGDVDIHGADITLTDVDTTWNLFVTASGDLTFVGAGGGRSGRIAVDNWIVLEADDVTQSADAGFSASRLLVDAADISLLGLNQVQTVGAVSGDSFAYRSIRAGGFDIAGSIDVGGGTVELIAENGGITQGSGYSIFAGSLSGSSQGGADFAGYNYIDALGDFDNTGGAFFLNVPQALNIVGTVNSDSAVVIQTRGGGMTIASTGTVSSTAAGDAVVLASDGVFTNNSDADAVEAPNGRWLIYTQASGDPNGSTAGDNYGGLGGKSYYGVGYDFAGDFTGPINAGNRFVHAYQPILTVTPNSQTVTYNGQIPTLTALITGFVNGDLVADAWSGSPLISGATSKNVGTYGLSAALGSLLSDMNYGFSFGSGTLIIDPKALTGTLTANNKTYDGATDATGSLVLDGVVAGDAVAGTVTGLHFADRNAGLGKTVTASGTGLSGADSGNYTLGSVGAAVADILRRTLTGVLTVNNKTYDGTTAATGSIGLINVVAGDAVSASGTFSFADRNAGVGKVVNADSLVLSGTDAGNYDLGSASGVADILRRAIGGTVVANNKTYDGSIAATGLINLTGVVAGDDIGAGATLAFDSRNAGLGRTVSAADAALSGADAGNYTLTGVASGIADILQRSLTGVLTVNNKTYDGATDATGSLVLDGVVAGDAVAGTVTGLHFADRNAGLGKTVTASGTGLSGADSGNYTLGSVGAAVADILRRTLTGVLTVTNKTYDGTTAATGSIGLTNVVAGDAVSASGTFSFADRNAGVGKVVNADSLVLSGTDAGNYDLGSASGVADILRRAISVIANNQSKRFGQADPALTFAVGGGGLVQGDVLAGGLARATGETPGAYVIGQGDLAASSNYILTFTPGELTIQIPPTGGVQSLQMQRALGDVSAFSLDRDPSPGLTATDGEEEQDP